MVPERNTAPHLLAIQRELVVREPIFHHPEIAGDRSSLEAMTDEAFWEVGASGRRYSREFVIETVLERYRDGYKDDWRVEEVYCQEIAQNNYLLTYTLHQGQRVTRRATLWRYTIAGWKIVYHQGTLVATQ